MAEYIDRDYVLKLLGVFNDRVHGDYHFMNGIETAKEIVEDAPSADVQPVKHGRWIQDEHTYSGCWTYNYVCSACGEIGGSWLRNIRRDQMFPYCPFCGAKMDSEE